MPVLIETPTQRDPVSRRVAALNQELAALGLPVEYRGGLRYRACPHCGGGLRWVWRQADVTHDAYAKCDGCRWAMWARQMAADIRRRYRIEVA